MSYIALLRGINVGGKNIVPMAALRGCLAGIGLVSVKTYIQSGNIVFRSPETNTATLVSEIGEAVRGEFNVSTLVQILTKNEMESALANNPFSSRDVDEKCVHLFFLAGTPGTQSILAAQSLLAASEQCQVVGRVFYLCAPNGIARSKLAARVEKTLEVSATARNLRSSLKILELAKSNAA